MDDRFMKKVRKLYKVSMKEGIRHLVLGCIIGIKGDLEECRTQDFRPSDSFIIKEENADIKRYSRGYTITPSTIPGYTEITKKRRGKCCPNYENKCRFVLEAVLRDVYGENNIII